MAGTGTADEMQTPPPRPRDRDSTRRAILEAAKAILADKGFAALGVNAVARDAGCDKQLVYRYFGGIEGLVDAIGEDIADWIGAHLGPLAPVADETYAARATRLLSAYLDALRGDALMRGILAWEVSDPSPHVRRLSAARSRIMAGWIREQLDGLEPPEGLDAPALNALLIAGVQHLALAGAVSAGFAGLPLESEADWDRVRATLRRLVEAGHDPGH